jgi:hypothetical protein
VKVQDHPNVCHNSIKSKQTGLKEIK